LNAVRAAKKGEPAVQYLAIDLGSRTSQICIRSESGELLRERSWETQTLAAYLGTLEPSHVVLETSAEAFAVARAARRAGHEVTVVPSTMSKLLGVGSRGVKTDQRDARALSLAACRLVELPKVHVPSDQASHLRSLLTSRDVLVRSRTMLVNHVRGYMRTQLHYRIRATPKTLPEKLRKSRLSIPPHIDPVLDAISSLNEQIRTLDREIDAIAKSDPVCRNLMTMPGVGPITATRFAAALDTRERFPNASSVTSYLGLTAGERSSGMTQRRTRLTKAGPAAVRHVLVQAAWSLWRTRPQDPISLWANQVAHRRGKQIAIVALARKMAGILFAMWRDDVPYDQQRAADTRALAMT
jgi:transposase